MKKVIRKFHQLRASNKTRYVDVKSVYDPKATYNNCFGNALQTGDAMVYGWLVSWHESDPNFVTFTPHTWNVKNGKHYDTTPIRMECEKHYIVDWDFDCNLMGTAPIVYTFNTYMVKGYLLRADSFYRLSKDRLSFQGPLGKEIVKPYEGDKYAIVKAKFSKFEREINVINLNKKEMLVA